MTWKETVSKRKRLFLLPSTLIKTLPYRATDWQRHFEPIIDVLGYLTEESQKDLGCVSEFLRTGVESAVIDEILTRNDIASTMMKEDIG